MKEAKTIKGKPRNTVVTDPIADMLTRIRNGLNARFESVEVPSSKIKKEIAKIMLEEGYLSSVEEIKDAFGRDFMRLSFKIVEGKQRVIQGLKRISKPGLRNYVRADAVPKVMNGLGIAILSTNKGLVTDATARANNLGGEVLAFIW